ncbi:(Fe-S)-binding protein [Thermonema rossianum]|uniref:(Fe-S)-binding protein n=1 Tax=Thermonema rossianum TaxID=55505 RepID=UPI00056EFC93|nr:(Fe-S)-binding protein [Thermonema rossianum]
MSYLPQILFALCLGAAGFFIARRVNFIRKAILLGKKKPVNDRKSERFRRMLLLAFGQKKMFDKPLVGIMHFIVYAGFLIINIEVLEIILDGITGAHRLFAPYLGSAYSWLINLFELFAVGVIVTCAIFLIRRNVLKVPRFWSAEMKKWPRLDANLILIFEITLMWFFLSMNAADSILQSRGVEHYVQVGSFWFSQWLQPLFENMDTSTLVFYERFAWWFHILGIFGFAIYVTYSKHLHIALAFPNTYFASLEPKGKMPNMDEVTKEVKIALGLAQADNSPAPERFGAKDVTDLNWIQLMSAFSCTECGRCTANCPANITGKKLSPRKIMMDTRDRAEEVVRQLQEGKSLEKIKEEKSLYGDYITKEEIMACTTCNACVEACPVSINPLSIILDIRRYVAMEEGDTPNEWNMMFNNLETSMSPWKFPPTDRFNWVELVNKD